LGAIRVLETKIKERNDVSKYSDFLRNILLAACCLLLNYTLLNAQEMEDVYIYTHHSTQLTNIGFIDPSIKKNNQHEIQKTRINYSWEKFKDQIAPIGGYKWGGNIIHNGDSIIIRSFELGVGFVKGEVNEWTSWGPIPMGWDWKQRTLPYLTCEYRWFKVHDTYQGIVNESKKLYPFMLNLGVSGARGGMLLLLPVPFAVEGMAGISTDFQDIYFRGKVGWNLVWFSMNLGGYWNLTQKATTLNYPHYMFVEFSVNIWRDNWYL
jgi:hypothetical protein